jgi:NAD(P)-dependent dehydrogenase (short-subunit alcohol dehydrogenase family)
MSPFYHPSQRATPRGRAVDQVWARCGARISRTITIFWISAVPSAMLPAGRPAEADEVAALFSFLVREDCRFITGQILSVNGGSSMS